MSGKRAIGLLSKKEHSEVMLYYDPEECANLIKKTISRPTFSQLIYYQKLLQKQPFCSFSPDIQPRIQIKENHLEIKSRYYACKSLKVAIIDINNQNKQFLPFRFLPIFSNLMASLIKDGNRQFMPTSSNIFIEETAAYVNLNSVVGINFIQSRSFISREDFIEIAPLLTPSLFQHLEAGKKVDFVKLKQRALLLAIVAMVENKSIEVQRLGQIPEKLTLQEASKFTVKLNAFLAKYLSSSTFINKLREKKIALNLQKAILKIIVSDDSLSWPELIELLVTTSPSKHCFDRSLCSIASSHWRQLPAEQKRFLQQSKIVQSNHNGKSPEMKQINLYLTLYTKTPLSSLLTEGSFTAILDKQTNFELEGFRTVNSLMDIMNQFQQERKKERDLQPEQNRQQSLETCLYSRKLGKGFSLHELIGISQKKMVKKIPRSKGMPFCMQHPMLQTMRLYSLALR